MREGEFVMAGVQRAVNGQKSYDWGRMNRRMQVRMAGLAEPTCGNGNIIAVDCLYVGLFC